MHLEAGWPARALGRRHRITSHDPRRRAVPARRPGLRRRRGAAALTLTAAVIGLGGCGGDAEPVRAAAASQSAKAGDVADRGASTLAPQATAVASPADQLMDHGEAAFAVYFPGHAATQSAPPFQYRHYPATGTYLGVVTAAGGGYALHDICVLGGPFGPQVQRVGQLTDFITPVFPAPDVGGSFVMAERWSTASPQEFIPTEDDSLIAGDAGQWIVGDTVSSFPAECGPPPSRAQIVAYGTRQALRLTSLGSPRADAGGCSANVWAAIYDPRDLPPGAGIRGIHVPLAGSLYLSFVEAGSLSNPRRDGRFTGCVDPPCFDSVTLTIDDNRGNRLAYVLQRHPDARPNTSRPNYREIFLDPAQGTYARDLVADFRTIPAFALDSARISSIAFEVDERGWATIADLVIGSAAPLPSAVGGRAMTANRSPP